MSVKYAVRNLRLCTKDCLCLYVCPTGATDTENSIIDGTPAPPGPSPWCPRNCLLSSPNRRMWWRPCGR